MSNLQLFIPIGKVDAARRIVYGTLTAEEPDKSGEIFDYATGKPAIQQWSEDFKEASGGKSLGNVRAMHDNIAAGKFTDIVFDDDNKRIQGAAKIIDDDEWKKVAEGVYTGFSIGGSYTNRWQDPQNPKLWRFTPKLTEVSLVDNPCVPSATFEYLKADGSVEMRKFIHTNQEESMTTADAGGQAAAVTNEPAADTNGTVQLVKDGKPVKPKAAPVQKNVWLASDGSEHPNKRAAEVHELHLEKQVELAPALSQMDALLKGAKKPDEDEEKEDDDEETKEAKKAHREEKAKKAKEENEAAEKKKADDESEEKKKEEAEKAAAAELDKAKKKDDEPYGDVEYADPGYQEDKKKRYPLDTEEHIRAAWNYINKEKNQKPYSAEQVGKIKAKIVAAWKEKIDKDGPPSAEKATSKGNLAKGLHQVGWLARLLDELTFFQDSVEIEQYFEDDADSELPAKLKALVTEMCDVLVTLVEEETGELTEGDDTDVEILEMAAGLPKGHPAAIAKAARKNAEPLAKSDSKKESVVAAKLLKFAEALEKAGARHSKADADRVQALHDHIENVHKAVGEMAESCGNLHKEAGEAKNTAIDLGAKGDRYEADDDEPANKNAAKMSKLYEQLNAKTDEVLAVSKVAAASNETLLKAIPLIESLQSEVGALKQEKSELVKRMEHLEKQPMPPKGHVRAMSKTQDSGIAGNGETDAEFKARLAKMTPTERSRELMKLAMSNPMESPAL